MRRMRIYLVMNRYDNTQDTRGVDSQQMLNALHVPKDAGEHAAALAAMLRRIPDGWGRWISCDRGWYPLLVELDEQLRMLLPGYVIHQVKEKFGGLRYYWASGEEIRPPDDPEPSTPGPDASEAAWADWRQKHEQWCQRIDVYLLSPQGQVRPAELRRRLELAEKLVTTAESRAAATCELCGAPGQTHRTRSRCPWYKTLCPGCAKRDGYVHAGESGVR